MQIDAGVFKIDHEFEMIFFLFKFQNVNVFFL